MLSVGGGRRSELLGLTHASIRARGTTAACEDLQQKKWFDFAQSLQPLGICRSYDSTMLHQLSRVLNSPW